MPAALRFVDDALRDGGQAFVHCLEGVSRSACVVVAWLCSRRGMTYDRALSLVSEARPCVDPFPAYGDQTRAWVSTRVSTSVSTK